MKRAAIIILSLLMGLSSQSFAAPPLEEILAALEQANEQIGVVKVEGYTHEYRRDDSASSWKVTPATSTFSCAFENKPQGRYVLNQNPSISRWILGAAPYLATWSTQFRDADGFITYLSRATQSHDGTQLLGLPQSRCSGEQADCGKKSQFSQGLAQRAERFYSGLGFTGLRAIRNTPVYAPDRFKDIAVSDTSDGMVLVHFESPQLCVAWDLTLDPEKNFALVRYTYSQGRVLTTADDEITQTYEVPEHRPIADGVWYPVHCIVTTEHSKECAALLRSRYPQSLDRGQDDPYVGRREELVLTKVSLLSGNDAETNLTVNLPEGTTFRSIDEHQ
jgi:hypothetical protein